MCNHHRDVLDAIRAEEEEAAAIQAQSQDHENHEAPPHPESPKEDSFEIPDNRPDLDESKATDHGPLEHEHEHTPYFSYHAEKALKLVSVTYVSVMSVMSVYALSHFVCPLGEVHLSINLSHTQPMYGER